MGSFSIWHWGIVLVIILLVFGTKKLRHAGNDLGGAVRGFKDGMRDSAEGSATSDQTQAISRKPQAVSRKPQAASKPPFREKPRSTRGQPAVRVKTSRVQPIHPRPRPESTHCL